MKDPKDMTPEDKAAYAQYVAQRDSGEPPTAWESVQRGMMDIGQGAKQNMLGLSEMAGISEPGTHAAYTDDVNSEIAQYNKHRDGNIDWYRMLGEAAPFLPAAAMGAGLAPHLGKVGKLLAPAATTSGRIGQGIGGGALAGGMAFDPQANEDSYSKAAQMLIGGVGGGAAGAILPLIPKMAGSLYRNIFKKADDVVEGNQLSKQLGFVDEKAPTRSQITRDPSEWYDEHETLAKSDYGAPLISRYRAQTDQFGRLRDQMDADIGATSPDKTAAAMASFGDISEQWIDSQKAVNAAYAKARMKAPGSSAELSNLKTTIDKMVDTGEADLSPHIGAARKLLYSRGITEEGQMIPLDMEQVENVRKVLTQRMSDATEPNDRRVIRNMLKGIDRDIDTAGDVFKNARKEASDRFKRFDNPIIKGIRDGKANSSNFINTKIIGSAAKVEDLLKVKELHLTGENPQVWNEVKGSVMNHLMDKGFQGRAATESAQFSGVKLFKELEKIGTTKLNIIFNPDEVAMLKGMAEMGEMLRTVPEGAPINFSNTGSTNIRNILKMAGKNPSGLVTEVMGGVQRAAANRNAEGAVQAALQGQPAPMINAPALENAINQGLGALGAGAAGGGTTQLIPDPVGDVLGEQP